MTLKVHISPSFFIGGMYRVSTFDGCWASMASTSQGERRNEESIMNAKRKGSRNEHRSIRLLAAAGYACCRSAASLGAWDIVAIGSTDIALVQVKTRDWPGATEMETLRMFPCPANCRKLVHRYRDGVRLPDVKEL